MKNLYLFICAVPSFASQQACGLRDFFSKDVSSRPGCINRVLPSTLSWAAQAITNTTFVMIFRLLFAASLLTTTFIAMSAPQDPIRELDVGSYAEISARPNPSNLTLQYVPSLVALLLSVENKKGSPLTKEEVEKLKDMASVMAVSAEGAKAVEEKRQYKDIDPLRVWSQWKKLRLQLH